MNSDAKVFITYRREDSAAQAGRLYDAMVVRFGEGNVFMDVDMAPGVDFVKRIGEAVAACQVLIVVMGREWATIEDEQGRQRLEDPDDFVRLEVETALRRPEVTPIPVLVGGAQMPARRDLPEPLRPITRRNAIELSDLRWRQDVGRLIGALDELVAEAPPTSGSPSATTASARETAPGSGREASRPRQPSSSWLRWRWALLGVLAIAAILIAVVVGAGGGGGDGGGATNEDQIKDVVQTINFTTDPEDCTRLFTQRFLDQAAYGSEDPVSSCRLNTLNTRDDPRSVDVANVQVSGDTATAPAHFDGGFFDGQTVVYSMLKDGDQWKLDHLSDIKDFDLRAFATEYAVIAPRIDDQMTQSEANCIRDYWLDGHQPASEVKNGILDADWQQLFRPPYRSCRIKH
jgi:hypothetical protein